MNIDSDSIVVRNDEPLAANVDKEVVLLSVQVEAYFGLGEIGSDIWEMIATPLPVSELCARLTERYDVDSDVCERDTLAFLAELLREGLIRVADKGSGAR